MALWKRAGIYYVKLTSPDGTLLRRSTGTTDRKKAEEYHDRLKAELWDLARLKRKPRRTWDEAALRWLKEKAHKKSIRDDVSRILRIQSSRYRMSSRTCSGVVGVSKRSGTSRHPSGIIRMSTERVSSVYCFLRSVNRSTSGLGSVLGSVLGLLATGFSSATFFTGRFFFFRSVTVRSDRSPRLMLITFWLALADPRLDLALFVLSFLARLPARCMLA